MVHCIYIEGCQVILKMFFLPEDLFALKSVDPDEMPHDAAFSLGLHCL